MKTFSNYKLLLEHSKITSQYYMYITCTCGESLEDLAQSVPFLNNKNGLPDLWLDGQLIVQFESLRQAQYAYASIKHNDSSSLSVAIIYNGHKLNN